MYAKILHTHLLSNPFLLHPSSPPSRLFRFSIRSAAGDDNSLTPPDPVPEPVEIRFRRGSRRQRLQQQRQGDGISGEQAPKKEPPPKKSWEEMTAAEKALELYLGEKGALFWLNKFAYASIFIIIGAWILFRFVGPALNLYQLDAPPLPPESIFKS